MAKAQHGDGCLLIQRGRKACFARVALVLVLGAAGCLAHLGCSNQSNPFRGLGSTSSAATAAGGSAIMITPVGPFPRGTVTAAHLPLSTATGPDLVVLAPDRGAQVQSTTTVAVRVRATDPEGVQAVQILGKPATSLGQDQWGATVALVPGTNVIDAEATDTLGNRSTAYVSVVQGVFIPDDRIQDETLAVALTPVGLRRVCDVAEQQTAKISVFSLIAPLNPIVNTAIVKVTANGLTHDPLRFAAAPLTPNGLEATVSMSTVKFDVEINVVGVTIARAALLADKATAIVTATIDRNAPAGTSPAKRALGLRVDRIDVALDHFTVVPSSALLATVIGPFTGIIKGALESKLKDILSKLAIDYLGKALPGFDAPFGLNVPVSLAGGTDAVDVQFQVDQAHGLANVGIVLEAGMRATKRGVAASGLSRNVFVTGARPTPLPLGPEPFAVGASVDAVNGLLHALWLTGSLGHRIDGTQPYAQGTMALQAKLLYPFIPAVRDLAPDPMTPFVVEISVGAPPLARLGTPQASFLASAGELQIRLLLDYMDGGPRLDLFTLRAAADVQVELDVSATEVRVTKLALGSLHADVIAEPTVDLADQELVDFVQTGLPWLLDNYTLAIKPIPIPALPVGLNLTSPTVEVRPDVLIIRGGL
jgi:hypothetical protein